MTSATKQLNGWKRWLEPELFQPFLLGCLLSLTLSEFVRGALTLSMLPTYGKTVLHFEVEWTALALSIHYLVDNVLRAPAGWVIDKLGPRSAILVGFLFAAISVYWMANVHSVGSMIAAAALYGIGVTPMWPSAISGISRTTPKQKRASFMGYMYIFWLVGTGLGPVLINFAIGKTYHTAFAILVGIDVLGFIVAFLTVKRIKTHSHAVSSVGIKGQQVPVEASQVIGHRSNRTDWVDVWRNVKEVAFLFPGMFAQTYAVASLIPILSLYAKLVLHLSGGTYSVILIAGGAIAIIALLPAGKLVDKFGPRKFLVPAFIVAALSLGLYPFFHTLYTTYLVVGILGFAYAFILPAWNKVLDTNIDEDKKATLWGVFMTVEGIGSAVGPYLGGLVWDRISPNAPFWVSGGVILIMGILYIFLPIEGKRGGIHHASSYRAGGQRRGGAR